MFDYLAEVMIEIQHSGNLSLVVDETILLDNGFKMFEVQIISFLGYQGFNYFFKVKPPEEQIMEGN